MSEILFVTDKRGSLTIYPGYIILNQHDPRSVLVHNSFALINMLSMVWNSRV